MASISLSIGGTSTTTLSIGSSGGSESYGASIGDSLVHGIGIPISIGSSVGSSTVSSIGSTISRFAPSRLCSSYLFDGTSISIPISCLPGLSVGEAHAVTGDWREIFQAICLLNHDWYEIFKPSSSLYPDTYRSFKLENPNARSTIFQYGIGELRTFLEEFNVTYKVSKLKDEN